MLGGHCVHAPPPVPHCAAVGVTHVEPVQQPPGHELAPHVGQVPPLHTPGRQLLHCAPPDPHCELEFPGSQVAPSQHPLQDVLSQTHAPLMQC